MQNLFIQNITCLSQMTSYYNDKQNKDRTVMNKTFEIVNETAPSGSGVVVVGGRVVEVEDVDSSVVGAKVLVEVIEGTTGPP